MNDAMNDQPLRLLVDRRALPHLQRGLTRRRLLSYAAVAGAVPLLAACGAEEGGKKAAAPDADSPATGGPLEDKLSIYSWGDYDSPKVLKNFTKELGPQIQMDSFGSNEELISKLVAAKGTGGYDIVVPTGIFIPQMVENGLLMKLNKELIPNLSHMDPDYLGRSWDPENDWSICKAWGTTGYVYDTTVIERDLTTWADFLDAAKNEASGKTSVLDDPGEVTGIYYWANGIDWNTTDPEEMQACEDYIVGELAPHISAFDSYPGSTAVPQGTAALIQIWNGDARQGITASKTPEKWKWVLGAPKTELWMDNWAICSTAPHPEAAHAFLDYVLEPDNALLQLDYTGYPTGAKDIEEKARAEGFEMLDLVFFTPEQVATMVDGEVNEGQARSVEIWNKAKAAASA